MEAETTAVPAGGTTEFALRFLDEDECLVRALGSIADGTGLPRR